MDSSFGDAVQQELAALRAKNAEAYAESIAQASSTGSAGVTPFGAKGDGVDSGGGQSAGSSASVQSHGGRFATWVYENPTTSGAVFGTVAGVLVAVILAAVIPLRHFR